LAGFGLVVLAAFCWAIDTLFRYPLISSGVSALQIVFVEHLFLMVFSGYVLWKSRLMIWKMEFGHIFYFFLIGGFGSAIGTLAFTKAFSLLNPSYVILLQKLQPLVAISMARFLLGEPISKKFLAWGSVCLLGGLLISFQDIFTGGPHHFEISRNSLYGYGLVFLAVVSWGSATVFGKKLSMSGFDFKEIMAMRFFFGFAVLLPLFVGESDTSIFDAVVLGKIFLMALISGAVAMALYYKGLSRISARTCAIAEMFFPLCAVVINWVFLGKGLTEVQIVGGVLLVIGSTTIQIKNY
jgi:drug/metabolite transporter (DMT)-like permease